MDISLSNSYSAELHPLCKIKYKEAVSKLQNIEKIAILALKNHEKYPIHSLNYLKNLAFQTSLPVPDEVVQRIFKYLSIKDLLQFAQVNHQANLQVSYRIYSYVDRLGYFNSRSCSIPKLIFYLKCLFREVKIFSRDFLRNKELVVFDIFSHKIDPEKTLCRFKWLSSQDILAAFEHCDQPFVFLSQVLSQITIPVFPLSLQDLERSHIALSMAIYSGQSHTLRLILNHGADPNCSHSKNLHPRLYPLTHLDLASYRGFTEGARILLLYGANPNTLNERHFSSLHYASGILARKVYFLDVMKVLLDHGADPNIRASKRSFSLLSVHAARGTIDVVKLILNYKVNINDQSSGKYTALSCAVRHNRYRITHLLLKHGADPNLCCETKNGPLHFAVQENQLRFVHLLLDFNADINLPGSRGDTPLIIAIKSKFKEIVQLLLTRNANRRIENAYKLNALTLLSHTDYSSLII